MMVAVTAVDGLLTAKARGNLVSGGHLAAISIEHGATFVCADRNFARFPWLSWMDPLS